MVKTLVLVPEAQFRRLQQCEQRSASTILSDVKHPNERELVKTYTDMERVIQDPQRSEQEKVAEHVDAMNDFTVLRDRVSGRREPAKEITKPAGDVAVDEAIDIMPPTLQRQARQLLQRLSSRNDLISWMPSGEVTIGGKRLVGSNIGDMVGDVLRSRKTSAPMRDRFLNVLAEANVPDEFVRNRQALSRYRKIKGGGGRTANHPPGLPDAVEVQIDDGDQEWEDIPEAPKKAKTSLTTRKKIKWKNV